MFQGLEIGLAETLRCETKLGFGKQVLFSALGLNTESEEVLRHETRQVGRGRIMGDLLCILTLF